MARKRSTRRRLASRDIDDCAEMSDRIAGARRQVARAGDARTRIKFQNKLRAFEATARAMGCRVVLGRVRRKRKRKRG